MTSHSGDTDHASDTTREALRVQYAALRRIPAARRLELMDDLTILVQTLCREGVRRRHPGATDEQVEKLYSELVLGRELASRVFEHRRARLQRPSP